MPLYNVGDVVMVRDDLEEDEVYGGCYATYEMAELAGCPVKISEVCGDGKYTVAETDEYNLIWTNEMFSGLAEQTQYQPGDIVLVKSDIEVRGGYKMLSGVGKGAENSIVDNMLPFAGRAVTIKAIDSDQYRIEEDNGQFRWTDEMFSGYAHEIEPSTDEEMMLLFGISKS